MRSVTQHQGEVAMEATLQGIFTERFAQYAQGTEVTTAAPSRRAVDRTVSNRRARRTRADSVPTDMFPTCTITLVGIVVARVVQSLPNTHWAEARHAPRLLACDHYHVVFTLPHELVDLWSWNRAWFVDRCSKRSRDTLMSLLADRRLLGAYGDRHGLAHVGSHLEPASASPLPGDGRWLDDRPMAIRAARVFVAGAGGKGPLI